MSNDTQHTPNIKARLFLRSSLSLGDFQCFLAAFETLRPLRTFGPLCPGKAAGTVSRSTEAIIAATAVFFYSLDLRLSRERGRASARQIKLLSIFSLEYIYLLYSLFLMLLLVACWTSVGCLLDVCWMSVVRSVGRMLRRIANVHFHWDL